MLSQTLIRAATAQNTPTLVLTLATFTHPVAGTRRLVNDVRALVSGGETFEATPFSVLLTSDRSDEPPTMTFQVENISGEFLAYARTALTGGVRPAATIQIVARDEPDIIGVSYAGLEVYDFSYDAGSINARLAYPSFQSEPYPAARFTPGAFPGMF